LGGESDEGLISRLVEAGLSGNMDEINALASRVLRGKIKAAIVKAKRTKA
jgi:ABC-type transporter lipoprotein component MlaA